MPVWARLASIAGVIALCGCGAGTSVTAPSSDVRVVASAPTAMAKASTCRITSVTPASPGSPLASATGVLDFAHHRAMLAGEIRTSASGNRTQGVWVIDGNTLYVKGMSLGATSTDRSKPWASIPLTGPAGARYANSSPFSSLAKLSSTGPVDVVGQEDVRGVRATHFRHHAPGGQLDTWIDARGLVRREVVSIALGQDGTVTSTQEYFDFGVPVNIVVPPASQVAPVPLGAPTSTP